jgi:hypothetical protein
MAQFDEIEYDPNASFRFIDAAYN